MKLETPRLVLRPVKPEEASAYNIFTNCEDYLRFMSFGPSTDDEMRISLEALQIDMMDDNPSSWSFSLYLKETDQLIGNILITRDDYPWGGIAKIGFGIHPDFWNQGFLTEALKVTTDFAHEILEFHRVTARCHTGNIGSWRALEKCGYVREGILHYAQYNAKNDTWDAENYFYASVRPDLLDK